MSEKYEQTYGSREDVALSTPQITELIYSHNIAELRQHLKEYLAQKGTLWILIDGIDKGWPSTGLEGEDLLIIRALIDASRKLEQDFSKAKIEVVPLVFLRNDVYELLVQETSDRGKVTHVRLDWTDRDVMREMLKRRVLANEAYGEEADFEHDVWPQICVTHCDGAETIDLLIDRSLMRPRFFLDLITLCKGSAVNLGHDRIDESDIVKGIEAYSSNLLTDIGYEIGDISEDGDQLLYDFLGCSSILGASELVEILQVHQGEDKHHKLIRLLLWYGFLGVLVDGQEPVYIYSPNVNYNMATLSALIRKQGQSLKYQINQAFWPALLIEES